MFDGRTYSAQLDFDRLRNNTTRVLHLLLDEQWHTIAELREVGGSAGDTRARDLRKERFGAFDVEVQRANGGGWHYRIAPGSVTQAQIDTFKAASRSSRAKVAG